RVTGEQNTQSYAKSGVMIRESSATNAVEVCVVITPTNGLSFICRTATGNSSVNVSGWVAGPTAPYWVRLVRSGTTFTGYSSADGVTWTQVASTNVTMATSALAGLCVTAHTNGLVNTSTFDNVGTVTLALADQDIGNPGLAGSASVASSVYTV